MNNNAVEFKLNWDKTLFDGHSPSYDEMIPYYERMFDDFYILYPFLQVHGFIPDVSIVPVLFVNDFDARDEFRSHPKQYKKFLQEHGEEPRYVKVGYGNVQNLTLETFYMMLKNAGADVSKYGLIETWFRIEEHGMMIPFDPSEKK